MTVYGTGDLPVESRCRFHSCRPSRREFEVSPSGRAISIKNFLKTLIVDDDPDVRLGMQVRLKANGYDIFFAVDVPSSVTEAHKHAPDLIILDLGLPAGDGLVVMDRLKTHRPLAAIPVIVVTARAVRANEARHQGGAKVFLQKPADNAQMLAVIRRSLGEPAQPGDIDT